MIEPRRKRGRPRLMPEWRESQLCSLFPDSRSKMGLHHKYYLTRAVRALREGSAGGVPGEQFRYLFDVGGKCKQTILSELGRIEEPEDLREVALYICEYRIRTDRAIAGIRVLRGVREEDDLSDWAAMFLTREG